MNPQPGSLQTLSVWAAVTAVSGIAAIVAGQWSGASANWVSHTLIVQQQLAKTLSAVQDLEAGQRGYILTGEERYLEPYERAKADLPEIDAVLNRLVSDNPDQLKLIKQIGVDVGQRLQIIDATIASVRSGDVGAARDLVKSGQGKFIMDRVRAAVAQAQVEEHRLFEQRQATYQSQRVWLLGALMAAILGGSGLAIIALMRERDRVSSLEFSSQNLTDLNKSLEERVAARTSELAYERDRAEAERERAEALLRDVTHRIGNTLALVVGFINLHIRHTRDPLSIKTLTGARSRIHAIASAQRRINVTNDLDLVRIDTLISSVMSDLVAASGEEAVSIDVQIQPLLAPAQSATSICVLTQEFVMNSLKHAFPDGRKGEISVSIEKLPESGARLRVVDNGVGMPETENTENGGEDGLGSKIATLLTRQFNGAIVYERADPDAAHPGTKITVDLPDLKLSRPENDAAAQTS